MTRPNNAAGVETAVHVRSQGEVAVAELATDGPPCPHCNGTGRIVRAKDNLRVVGRCSCQRLPDRIAIFNRAGLPARHATSTLQSFEVNSAFIEVSRWRQRFEGAVQRTETMPGLVLHGGVGRGKTHLLVGLVRWMILDLGLEVRFVEFTRLLAQLREGFDKGQSDRSVMGELVQIPVLAIDELGKGRLTEWELSVVDELVSRRYDAMLPVLATTNYRREGPSLAALPNLAEGARLTQTIGDRVGERVYSRMRDMCEFIEVGGQDYRLRERR